MASGPVWTGALNLTSTGILSSDLPVRSQSLYQLRYPAHYSKEVITTKNGIIIIIIIIIIIFSNRKNVNGQKNG